MHSVRRDCRSSAVCNHGVSSAEAAGAQIKTSRHVTADIIVLRENMVYSSFSVFTYLLTLIVALGLPDYLEPAINQEIGGLACCGRTLRSVGCAD
ncbi:MAG: hypothetical protein PHP20_10105, partial [Firmicutes bacterium]|nr:hypothetical protein [Bacillota bacterium]